MQLQLGRCPARDIQRVQPEALAGAAVNQAVNAIRKPKDEPPPAQQPKED